MAGCRNLYAEWRYRHIKFGALPLSYSRMRLTGLEPATSGLRVRK